MGKFRFYHIEEEYVNYLHRVDVKVQLNKGEHRPYVGVVLKIGKWKYYVPLESPKPNHINSKSGGPVLKLDEGRLGIMGFNNMIPVEDQYLVKFDFCTIQDDNYRNLLFNQYAYCEKNKDLILSRAKAVYDKTIQGNVPFYRQVCCHFKRLEGAAKRYHPEKSKK